MIGRNLYPDKQNRESSPIHEKLRGLFVCLHPASAECFKPRLQRMQSHRAKHDIQRRKAQQISGPRLKEGFKQRKADHRQQRQGDPMIHCPDGRSK